MCFFCGSYWPLNSLTRKLLGTDYWLHGSILNDLSFVYTEVIRNWPTEYPEIHVWLQDQFPDYREMIHEYFAGEEEQYAYLEKCTYATKTAQYFIQAKCRETITIDLWKPVFAKK